MSETSSKKNPLDLDTILNIAIAVTLALSITLNIEFNNTINNYIQEDEVRDNQTINNITKIKTDIKSMKNIQEKIYKEVR